MPPVAKIAPTSGLPPVANDDSDYDDLQIEGDVEEQKGWRLEQKKDGMWRWRWQLKYDNGDSVTYTTSSGKTGYKRGSKYVKVSELDDAKDAIR